MHPQYFALTSTDQTEISSRGWASPPPNPWESLLRWLDRDRIRRGMRTGRMFYSGCGYEKWERPETSQKSALMCAISFSSATDELFNPFNVHACQPKPKPGAVSGSLPMKYKFLCGIFLCGCSKRLSNRRQAVIMKDNALFITF